MVRPRLLRAPAARDAELLPPATVLVRPLDGHLPLFVLHRELVAADVEVEALDTAAARNRTVSCKKDELRVWS